MIQFSRTMAIGRKDMESYYTKPPLVTWALLFPAVLMLAVFVKDPAGYLKVAPGIIAMTLLFGCTSMAAIVITFEKRTKTLRRLLLTPVSNETILFGKAGSASAYGLATTFVLTLGLILFLGLPMASPAWFILGLILGACVFSLLGIIASVMVQEVFEAMTLMNFFRFPTLFISGVFMPLAAFPAWLLPLAMISPLTYVAELLRYGISGEAWFHHPLIPASVLAAFLAASWVIALKAFKNRATR
ncbi:ABC transporter permease [Dethiosulfatarculus sandiegensis]|uniref:Transport permease protein n=1 Tax=Dethiosulfatarculus sandiegensis TaxID=1429043 RepID=A0A0D2JBJ6_9BACT|nr:ABC transporter permease [Dethiosulfatarculus sandiegensis]KIX13126.1 multidrug ABC transporter permease [Dethiosulfatarculus sandiegensis]